MRNLLPILFSLCFAVSAWAQADVESKGHHILKIIPAPKNITEKPEFKDCRVYQRPDGRVYRVVGNRVIRADGSCPPEFVDGKLIGTNEIEIAKHENRIETSHRICTLTPMGSCGAIRLLDHPTIPSTTVFNVTIDWMVENGQSDIGVHPASDHILRVGKARGFIALYPGDWSTCSVVYVPDGAAYVSRGKTAAASGNCPQDIFVPAKLIGKDEIQIANRVCKLNEVGRCMKTRYVSDSLPLYMPNDGSSW